MAAAPFWSGRVLPVWTIVQTEDMLTNTDKKHPFGNALSRHWHRRSAPHRPLRRLQYGRGQRMQLASVQRACAFSHKGDFEIKAVCNDSQSSWQIASNLSIAPAHPHAAAVSSRRRFSRAAQKRSEGGHVTLSGCNVCEKTTSDDPAGSCAVGRFRTCGGDG